MASPGEVEAASAIAAAAEAGGSQKQKVLPFPRVDSAQILPPCSSTIPFEMKSPSPVPPALRVVLESS